MRLDRSFRSSIFCNPQMELASKHTPKTKSRSPASAFPFPKRPTGAGHLSTSPQPGSMMLAIAMHRRRGNPHFGQPFSPSAFPNAGATEFDRELRRLGLTRETCVGSSELRRWCQHNKERCYIPEWLLKEWGIDVDADLYGAA
jgi:hypothetical protein